MEKGPSSKKGEKNFMWSNRRDRFLISFLAECAKNGEKHGKSFRKSVYTKAANKVTDTFSEVCTSMNVESRMKTVKKRYANIKKLREKSGWGWDDEQKMIIVDKAEELAFIEENSYAKGLLNVPIDQYEELKIVCGEDQATGSFARSDVDLSRDIIGETSANQETSEGPLITNDTSGSKSGRSKRSRPSDEMQSILFSKLDGLTTQVSRLTESLISTDQDFFDNVYSKVMKTEGFDDQVLCKAFEYLTEHPLTGRQFISKLPFMRKQWMDDFASTLG